MKRRDPFDFFSFHSVAKYQKIEGGPFEDREKFFEKSHIAEKMKEGTLAL